MSSQHTPASVRYLKARLRPLGRPAFWLSTAVMLGLALILWESVTNPDWLESLQTRLTNSENATRNQDQEAEELTTTADGTELTAEELAIAADIDNVSLLLSQLTPISVAPTPQNNQPANTQPRRNSTSQQPNAPVTAEPANPFSLLTPPVGNTQPTNPATASQQSAPGTALSNPTPTATAPVNTLQLALERNQGITTPSASGTVNSSVVTPGTLPVASEQLRPNAYGLIAAPSQTTTIQSSPNLQPSASAPTNSYEYLMQSAPNSKYSVPSPVVAPVPASPKNPLGNTTPIQGVNNQSSYGYPNSGMNNPGTTPQNQGLQQNNASFQAPNSWPQGIGGGRINTFSNP